MTGLLFQKSNRQFKLRCYQQEAAEKALESISNTSHDAGIIVMPTGSGKTVVGAKIVQDYLLNPFRGRMVMIISHRTEIVLQWYKLLDSLGITSSAWSGMLGREYKNQHSYVNICTVQTLNSKTGNCQWMLNDAGLVLFDEVHHAAATTWMKTMLTAKSRNPKCYFLGMTATPFRSDRKSIYKLFCNNVIYSMSLLDAIEDGWIVPLEQQFIECSTFKAPKSSDIYVRELIRHMKEKEVNDSLCSVIYDIIKGKKSIIFAGDVEHATQVHSTMRDLGIQSECITGTSDKDYRLRVMSRFASGDLSCLVNCNIYTEGYDAVPTQCIVMMRPTKSSLLYAQMVGRGLRPMSGVIDDCETAEQRKAAIARSQKPSVLVVDVVGNSFAHRLATSYDMVLDVSKFDIQRIANELYARQSNHRSNIRISERIKIQEGVKMLQEHPVRTSTVYTSVPYTVTIVDPFSREPVSSSSLHSKGAVSRAVMSLIKSYLMHPCQPPICSNAKATAKQQRFLMAYGLVPSGHTPESIGICKKLAAILIGETIRRWREGLPSIPELAEVMIRYPTIPFQELFVMPRHVIYDLLRRAGVFKRIRCIPDPNACTQRYNV